MPTSSSSSHHHHHRPFFSVHSSEASWDALKRHCHHDVESLTLRQLLSDDDRVSALVVVHATESDVPTSMTVDHGHNNNNNNNGKESRSLIVDLSRQRMTMDTLNLLFRYATACQLPTFVRRVAWGGQNDPRNPVTPHRVRPRQPQSQRKTTTTATRSRVGTTTTTTTTFLEMEALEDQIDDPHHANAGTASSSSSSLSSSMHMALRVPAHPQYEMFDRHGHNVLHGIHREWDRIERTSDCYRRGQLRGSTGRMIQHILVIGRGVPIATLQFVNDALRRDERAALASRFGLLVSPAESAAARLRRGATAMAAAVLSPGAAVPSFVTSAGSTSMGSSSSSTHPGAVGGLGGGAGGRSVRILSSIDPLAVAEVTSDLDPASTLVISVALRGDEETGLATKAVKGWLLRALANPSSSSTSSSNHQNSNAGHQQQSHSRKSSDYVLKHHMVLVTGNDHIAAVINKPESVYVIPQHTRSEPFTSFTSAVLLPLSIVYGWTIVKEFLDGARDMDNHFASAKMRQNVPVLLALCDVWNAAFLGASTRVVTPCSRSFASFPAMVASLEAQACSKPHPDRYPHDLKCPASLVLDGGDGSVYDRVLYQSPNVVNTELIVSFDNQLGFNSPRAVGMNGMADAVANQDAHMCSLFAHADELALGHRDLNDGASAASVGAPPALSDDDGDASGGNRPSTMIFTGRVDAFVCGQLVALSEHRAVVKAHLLGYDPFVGRCGASMRLHRSDQLKETLHTMFQADDTDPDDDDIAADPTLNLATRTLLRHYANHSLMFKQNFERET